MSKIKFNSNKRTVIFNTLQTLQYNSNNNYFVYEKIVDNKSILITPEIHPCTAYYLFKDKYSSFEEFKSYFNIKELPEFKIQGNDITDALYLLFTDRNEIKELIDQQWEESDKKWDEETIYSKQIEFNEEEMIEFCFEYLINTNPTEFDILNWIHTKNKKSLVKEAIEVYIDCLDKEK